MKHFWLIATIVLGLGVVYKIAYPTYVYRFKLVIDLRVGDQPRSGESVVEVAITEQPHLLPEMLAVTTRVRGEAVFVDLGAGRNVVALLVSGDFGENIGFVEQLIPVHIKPKELIKGDLRSFEKLSGRWELTDSNLPTMISFSNPAEPKSVRVVKPEQFPEYFGPEVRWGGAHIEMTRSPVTSGIVNRLPWLKGMASWLGDSTITKAGQFTLNRSYFIR